jgi:hypothetical protein
MAAFPIGDGGGTNPLPSYYSSNLKYATKHLVSSSASFEMKNEGKKTKGSSSTSTTSLRNLYRMCGIGKGGGGGLLEADEGFSSDGEDGEQMSPVQEYIAQQIARLEQTDLEEELTQLAEEADAEKDGGVMENDQKGDGRKKSMEGGGGGRRHLKRRKSAFDEEIRIGPKWTRKTRGAEEQLKQQEEETIGKKGVRKDECQCRQQNVAILLEYINQLGHA